MWPLAGPSQHRAPCRPGLNGAGAEPSQAEASEAEKEHPLAPSHRRAVAMLWLKEGGAGCWTYCSAGDVLRVGFPAIIESR